MKNNFEEIRDMIPNSEYAPADTMVEDEDDEYDPRYEKFKADLAELDSLCEDDKRKIEKGISYDLLMRLIEANEDIIYESDPVGFYEGTTVDTLLDFMKEYPEAKAYGHVKRDSDGEIILLCLEGVFRYGRVTKKVLKDFYEYFYRADDITVKDNYIDCWYD